MSDLAADLNYDCNYNMFLTKTMLNNLKSRTDRQFVLRWLRKLTTCNRSIEEMYQRNAFMYYLVLNVQNGDLRPPFNSNPPLGQLPGLDHLETVSEESESVASEKVEGAGPKKSLDTRREEGISFLATSPLPKVGALCYLAVLSKRR